MDDEMKQAIDSWMTEAGFVVIPGKGVHLGDGMFMAHEKFRAVAATIGVMQNREEDQAAERAAAQKQRNRNRRRGKKN